MAQTVEERRAAAAARMRAKRASVRAVRDAAKKAALANGSNVPRVRAMRRSVTAALAAAKWLAESDVASRQQALMLADDVDACLAIGDRVGSRAAHRALSRVLNDLGMTPTVRLQRELRSRKVSPEVPDAESGSSSAEAGNVSQFKRPQKRRA